MLSEQRLANEPEHGAPAERRPAGRGQFFGERLDHVEHGVDLTLVARERHGFGERVGDDQKARRRQVLDLDRAARGLLLVAVGRNFEHRRFVVAERPEPADARSQLRQQILFLERAQTNHHRNAEAKQSRHASFADAEGERQRGDHVGPLEAGGVDALANDERARRQARRSRRRRDVGHAVLYGGA